MSSKFCFETFCTFLYQNVGVLAACKLNSTFNDDFSHTKSRGNIDEKSKGGS